MKYHIYWPLLLLVMLVSFGCNMQQATEPGIQQQSERIFHSKITDPYFPSAAAPPMDTIIIIEDFFSPKPSCAGEGFEFSTGALHFLVKEGFDNTGRHHFKSHINAINISAVGANGAKYRITGSANTGFRDTPAGSYVSKSVSNFGLVGKRINIPLNLEFRYTINEDNKIVIEAVHFSCSES